MNTFETFEYAEKDIGDIDEVSVRIRNIDSGSVCTLATVRLQVNCKKLQQNCLNQQKFYMKVKQTCNGILEQYLSQPGKKF